MKLNSLNYLGAAATLLIAACSDPTPPPVPVAPVKPVATKPVETPQVDKPVPVPIPPTVKPGQITSVDMGQLFTMSQTGKLYLIDTRPPLFFRLGHIDGANSLPLIKYDKAILDKKPQIDAASKAGKVIVAYCQNVNCPDAHKLATKLSRMGYNVSIYSGGWEEWKRSGIQP